MCDEGRSAASLSQSGHVSGRRIRPHEYCPSCAPTRKVLAHFLRGEKFRIGISEASFDFRHLLIGEPKWAFILLFHKLDDVRDIGLPFRRPSQHTIKDRFDLVSGHGISIA
jgi:hypothetical protein